MTKSYRVFLEPREQVLAKRLADRRLGSKYVKVGEKSYTRNTTPWESHYIGLQGEIAVGKLLRYPIGEFISPSGDGDEPDLFWGRRSVEVKTTKYSPPILKLDKLTDFVTDVLVLCYLAEESVIDVMGWVSKSDFFDKHSSRNFGYGERAIVEEGGLNPASDLIVCEHGVNRVRIPGVHIDIEV